MVSPISLLLRGLKKVIRPLVPDWLMARYRLAQLSRHSRVNVDVLVADRKTARRWLAVTPDTYRARLLLPHADRADDAEVIEDPDVEIDEETRRRALWLLADPDVEAVVVGEVVGTQLDDRRRAEPEIAPSLIAAPREVVSEVGGPPPGDHPLPGLLSRLRDAGRHLGFVPVEWTRAPSVRSDPIDAPSVVIMAVVPLHDVGGGARSSQLAFELLRQGFHVTVLHFAEASESVDLGLRYIHPRLEQYRAERFPIETLSSRVTNPTLAILEAPFGSLVDPAVHLQRSGWRLVYDLIDDWTDPALGSGWYNPDLHTKLIHRADRIIASAPDLAERARAMGRDVTLIPNAVNSNVFGVDLPPRPEDLPEAEVLLGYHGSLYGNWLDWEALTQVGETFSDAAVVVIGDDRMRRPAMPDNVHFLGLKAQGELPAYVQRFDAGLIPFEVSDTTHAVSPLKAYEYLASGVPVAAPPLRALENLEGIFLDDDLVLAVAAALSGPRPDRAVALRQHSWTARVGQLGLERPKRGKKLELKVVNRPVVHYLRKERGIS